MPENLTFVLSAKLLDFRVEICHLTGVVAVAIYTILVRDKIGQLFSPMQMLFCGECSTVNSSLFYRWVWNQPRSGLVPTQPRVCIIPPCHASVERVSERFQLVVGAVRFLSCHIIRRTMSFTGPNLSRISPLG